jgi:hypothetical protein
LPPELRERIIVNTNAETNTNGGGEAEQAQRLIELKGRTGTLITTLLARVNTTQTKVNENKNMPDEFKATLLTDLAQDRAFLQSVEGQVAQAQTTDAVRTAAQSIRQYMNARKERIAQRRGTFTKKLQGRFAEAQQVGGSMISRLEGISESLKGHGVDTAELNTQIGAYQTSVDTLKNVDVDGDPDALRNAVKNMRMEIQEIIATIKELIKSS